MDPQSLDEQREATVARAESFVQKLRNGEMTGFIAIASNCLNSDAVLVQSGVYSRGETIALLELAKYELLKEYANDFGPDTGPRITAVDEGE